MNRKAKDYAEAYLFLLPAALIIGLFGLFPVVFTVFVSLHRWRIRNPSFNGLANYATIFGSVLPVVLVIVGIILIVAPRFARRAVVPATRGTIRRPAAVLSPPGEGRHPAAGRSATRWWAGTLLRVAGAFTIAAALPLMYAAGDRQMLDSLRITVWYSLGTVPFQLVFGLAIAILLDQRARAKQAFRVLYLLPYIVPTVASAAVFERLFSLRPDGFANQIWTTLGGEPLQWLREPLGIFTMLFGWGAGATAVTATPAAGLTAYLATWAQGPSLALVSIILYNHWVYTGYYGLIYANGLANIPRQLYEAAEVDGASRRMVFFRITVPLLSPTTYFLTMLGIIGTFKSFNSIWVLRSDAVRGAADPISIYIFTQFYSRSQFGYAAALALILFGVVLALTLAQRRMMENRVEYGE